MSSFLLGRKAQANNYFAAIVFLLSFGIMNMIGYTIILRLVQTFVDAGLYTGQIAAAGASFLFAMSIFDYIIVMVMVVLIIGIIITSYKLNTAPVFFFVNFFMGIYYGLVSYFFNYIFGQIVSDAVFAAVVSFFPRTIIILTNLHWIMLIMIVLGSITLFGKKPTGQFLT